MWQCNKCREQAEDPFEVCWNCGTSREGVENPSFRRAEHIRAEEIETPLTPPPAEEAAVLPEADELPDIRRPALTCLRCGCGMDFPGEKSLHKGYTWGILGDWNEENLDLYACRRCGKVELFLTGSQGFDKKGSYRPSRSPLASRLPKT